MPKSVLALLLAALGTSGLAQVPAPPGSPSPPDPAPTEAAKLATEVQRNASQLLLAFAHAAESNKMLARAKVAYELTLALGDADNPAARSALGYRKEKGQWVMPQLGKPPRWADAGDAGQRKRVADLWVIAKGKLVTMHRELGVRLLAQNEPATGQLMLERALRVDPEDAESHKALGHGEYKGFYGTPTEIEFLQRLAAIEAKAKALGEQDYEVKPLAAELMPAELKATGLEFSGVKSRMFTLWARASQEETAAIAAWGERAVDFVTFLLDGDVKYQSAGRSMLRELTWICVLRTEEERDLFFSKNPRAYNGLSPEHLSRFSSHPFKSSRGLAIVGWHGPEVDFDRIVARVAEQFFAKDSNDGLGQGFVHATTWFLLGTTYSWFGAMPATEASHKKVSRKPSDWLTELREQIANHSDWPLQQVPRETLALFRHQVRIKSWYFVVWLLARYPEQWARLLHSFHGKTAGTQLMPEECKEVYARVLDGDADEIENEWRQWASGESRLAKASGHGQ